MPPLVIVEPVDHLISNSDRYSECDNDCDDLNFIPSRVHFSYDLPQICTIPNREDFTSQEIEACWYTADEKARMKKECEEIMVRMDAGKRPIKNTSYRGLENYYKSNSEQYEFIIAACKDAVLDEQERQWTHHPDKIDWLAFREASSRVSAHSSMIAYKMAVYDENEARKAYVAMAKEQHQIKHDDSSVSTDASKSTLTHEVKSKHNATVETPAPRPSRRRSSGSRKAIGDVIDIFKRVK